MFIEKLWEQNPELVIKGLSYILGFDKSRFETDGKSYNGHMLFHIKSVIGVGYSNIVNISDFDIFSAMGPSIPSNKKLQWMKFMHKVVGEEYIEEYITYRNNELDKFMYEYEKNYTNDTINALAELGIKKYQDMQNQTK